jgi:hypothetical protein
MHILFYAKFTLKQWIFKQTQQREKFILVNMAAINKWFFKNQIW